MTQFVALMSRVVVQHANPSGLLELIQQVLRPEPGGYSIQFDGALSVSVLVAATLLLPVGPDFVGEGVVQKELWGIG